MEQSIDEIVKAELLNGLELHDALFLTDEGREAYLNGTVALIASKVLEARIDENKLFKLNRSHSKGELELVENRLAELQAESEATK